MPEIVISPATTDRFEDAEHALSGGGDGRSCQCQWWTVTNAQFQSSSAAERAKLLENEMRGDLPPALIAYVDGEAAGWIRVGPRTAQQRILRARDVVGHSAEPLDDPSVWAVTCFVVRKEHRGAGLNLMLLTAAIEFARQHGARVLEGYPTDTSIGKKPSNELFRGILSVFEHAGFEEIARPKPARAIVSLDLAS